MYFIGKRVIRCTVAYLACSVFTLIAAAQSIRNIDLRNYSYPFVQDRAVPEAVRWMPIMAEPRIELKDGRHVFTSADCRASRSGCPLLSVDEIRYGEIASIPREVAVVVMTYHTGGTATWQYVYVVSLQSGSPEVIGWLETGSRGYEGLRRLSIDHGELVVVVNDPTKRSGDCCSAGSITIRYRWHEGSFQEIGSPVPSEPGRQYADHDQT